MQLTIDISDALLAMAEHHAHRAGISLRALVEDGLRRVLEDTPSTLDPNPYRVPDQTVGNPDGPNPLDHLSWDDLRHETYGGR